MSILPAGIFPENRVRFPAAPESRIFPAARNRRQEKVAAFRTFLPVEIDHEEVGDETEFDALDPVCRSIFKGVKALRRRPGDTPELLQRRVMEQAEWIILPQAIDLIANGRVSVANGHVTVEK